MLARLTLPSEKPHKRKSMKKLQYDELSSQLADWAGVCSCSEIHGLISGLASVGLAADYQLVETVLLRHLEEQSCSALAADALKEIQESILEQLDDNAFSFEALIPDDGEELYLRVQALSEWCQGFLVGFGTGVKAEQKNFSQETQEVLRDLVEISSVDADRNHVPEEEDEVALTELEEYVRTAVMMLYSEFVLNETEKTAQEASEETFH